MSFWPDKRTPKSSANAFDWRTYPRYLKAADFAQPNVKKGGGIDLRSNVGHAFCAPMKGEDHAAKVSKLKKGRAI